MYMTKKKGRRGDCPSVKRFHLLFLFHFPGIVRVLRTRPAAVQSPIAAAAAAVYNIDQVSVGK
jgi:hypothetical protein